MTAAEAEPKGSKVDRRHPLVVTSDRLADHCVTYQDHITPAEQREIVSGGDPS